MTVNACITGGLPDQFKYATIRPHLKKGAKKINELSSYRPVSNLPFLSKLTERVIADRLTSFLCTTNALDPSQFAYRHSHSCETALLTVTDAVFTACDKSEITVLALMDLSAAFDTLDHTIMISRLSNIGIAGDALSWFRGYLRSRVISVQCNDAFSSPSPLMHGVPQGSVLGPVLFSIYMRELAPIILKHNVQYVIFADDIQLYISCSPSQLPAAISRLEKCIADIRKWLADSQLVLNPDKTELIIFGTRPQLAKLPDVSLRVADIAIPLSARVRDLGVILDPQLTMKDHIASISKTAFAYLRVISRQRYYLDDASAALLIHSLVLSRLDYCSSLLYGISHQNSSQLQRIINYAVRVANKLPRTHGVSDALDSRGWLLIKQRIALKIITLTFNVLKSGLPLPVAALLHLCPPRHDHQTRQALDPLLLDTPRSRTKMGDRAFRMSAPHLWNVLPLSTRQSRNIGTFKANAETFVRQGHYN
jgi:hypothetical protein